MSQLAQDDHKTSSSVLRSARSFANNSWRWRVERIAPSPLSFAAPWSASSSAFTDEEAQT